MVKRKLGALEKVEADLPNLRHKIRRDPLSYEGDFQNQWQQYSTMRDLITRNPASASSDSLLSLKDIVDFIAHVADCYPRITERFPSDIAELLSPQLQELDLELREKLVGALVLIRKKGLIDSPSLLNTLFPLLVTTPSKSLRTLIYQRIISDVRSSNARTQNHKLNRMVQTTLHNLLIADRSSPNAIWAVRITKELWRRQIWTDSKAAEIMKEAALADNVKVIMGAISFFLGGDQAREEIVDYSEDDGQALDLGKLRHQALVNKKSRKNERDLRSAAAALKKKERKKAKVHPLNFPALHLLHDPQSFAEMLFSRHLQNGRSKLKLDRKLLVLQLISRLVGLHELTIISLYSYFLKYLTPRQESVTSFLASLAQSVHKSVPPDVLQPLLLKIANEFVSEASASQVAAAGLNSIREICARQPLAMTDTLLQDLVMYKRSKDKGVMMAAKGLLSLYREVGPDKLRRRDRGRAAAMDMQEGIRKERRFGEVPVGTIEGLDLLEAWKDEEWRKKRQQRGLATARADEEGDEEEQKGEEDEEAWNEWEVAESDSDASDGWIDVESDMENIVISDSEDESRAAKRMNLGKDADASLTKNQSAASWDATTEGERISNLATSRILTPADLAKLNELRLHAAASSRISTSQKRQIQHAQNYASASAWHPDNPVTAESLVESAKLGHKISKEEKIKAAKGDIDDKHSSTTALRKEKKRADGKSSTNKEKARKKNFLMTLGKARGKQKRSLQEVRRTLKAHVDRQRRGGKRGNVGR